MTATLTTLVSFPYPTSGAGSPLTDLIADSPGRPDRSLAARTIQRR